MADMHITRELLEAIARGEIPVRVLEDLILEHLKKVCPHCRREMEEFAREQEAERKGKGPGPGFEAVSAVLDRHLKDLQQGQDRARRDVEKLLKLPQDERIARIKRSRTRYRGRQVAWILLEESRAAVTASPDEAEHLAELARLVVQYSPGEHGEHGPAGSGHGAHGERLPRRRQVRRGRPALRVCPLRDHAAGSHRHGDPRPDRPPGRLPSDESKPIQRRREAPEPGGHAVLGRRRDGRAARTLIKLGGMYFLQGELIRAIETTKAGLLDLPGQERYLYLCGRYNLARFLTESGQYREADEILQEDEELHREFPEPWTQLRLVWLRGKIEAGRGERGGRGGALPRRPGRLPRAAECL